MNDIQIMYNEKQLSDIAQAILKEAKQLGAHQAEVRVTANKGFSVSVHNQEVETIEYNQDKVIDIVVYFGKRLGSASVSDIHPSAWQKAVRAACHIAKFTDEDPASGLAEPEELAFDYPLLDLARHWSITVEEAIRLAAECEYEALHLDKRIMSAEEVSVRTAEAWHIYANSHHFLGYFPSASHEISCVLIGKQEDEMQRDYSYTIATNPELMDSPSKIAHEAVKKTVGRLGARQLATMNVPVIFVEEEARSLIGHFAAAIKGGALYRRSSFLLDQLNQAIFPSFMDIREEPHLPQALGSAPFDDEGVLTRHNHFIEHGILRQYALGTYSARKLKMKTTGNAGGFHNLVVKTSDHNLAALIKQMHRGLLITELMGQGANIVTGDYSRGASGYWVEHGEIQYPVSEITVAGNLRDIYKRIVSIGNDIDKRGNILTGSIFIEEMTIAGS